MNQVFIWENICILVRKTNHKYIVMSESSSSWTSEPKKSNYFQLCCYLRPYLLFIFHNIIHTWFQDKQIRTYIDSSANRKNSREIEIAGWSKSRYRSLYENSKFIADIYFFDHVLLKIFPIFPQICLCFVLSNEFVGEIF